MFRSSVVFLFPIALAAVSPRALAAQVSEDQAVFTDVMQRLAEAWNEGDAHRAADCFTEDAIYSEPPAQQLYRGREALYEFFGGESGRALDMHMVWHHLAYDPATGVGMGEFSFRLGDGAPAHGVVVTRLVEGRIANWREYYYESELSWEEFTAANPF